MPASRSQNDTCRRRRKEQCRWNQTRAHSALVTPTVACDSVVCVCVLDQVSRSASLGPDVHEVLMRSSVSRARTCHGISRSFFPVAQW